MTSKLTPPRFAAALLLLLVVVATTGARDAAAQSDYCCQLPDNGAGTVTMPPNCLYGYQGPMQIVDGLPPGSPLQVAAKLYNFSAVVEAPGGTMGGTAATFSAVIDLALVGTGVFNGFVQTVPIANTGEIHTAPRAPGTPVQFFLNDVYMLSGSAFTAPNFDLLRITFGNGFGLPSPGQTTLVRQGGPGAPFAVDSFFDVTYRIDFIGSPGGPFAGMSGSTTGLTRIQTCSTPVPNQSTGSWGEVKSSYLH
jgi:hypothetical protein